MNKSQKQAIEVVREYSLSRVHSATQTLQAICDRSNVSHDVLTSILKNIEEHVQKNLKCMNLGY